MADQDPSGKRLERLVATLEGIFAGANADIEAPCRRLTDKDTGKPREHDVVITWDHGHHRIVTAIECRDRSRPVGVPDVEAFADKCSATGVHSGVIVSASGFRNSAREKAKARAITCMDLEEVERFDWLDVDAFVGYGRTFAAIDLHFMFDQAAPEAVEVVFDGLGNAVSFLQINNHVMANVPIVGDPENEVGKTFPVEMRLQVEGWTARDTNGQIWAISYIIARTSFTTNKKVAATQSHRYVGGGKDYSIASADVEMGPISAGKVFMVRHEDQTTSVHFAPAKRGGEEANQPGGGV